MGGIAWFPDGRHVAVAVPAERSKARSAEANVWSSRRIARFDIDTGEETPLTGTVTGGIGDAQLAISPDGKMLAFVQGMGAGGEEIYLLPLERGGEPRRLTNLGAVYLGLAWSANSQDLIFAMAHNGRQRLWRLPVKGGTARPITSSLELLSSPTVARQGNHLAYVVYSGSTSLWELEIQGTHQPAAGPPRRFIYSTGLNASPTYSRDGNKLAFESNRAGSEEIWISNAQGGDAVQLTNSGGPDNGTPRWSPDGSSIVFDSRIKGNREILVIATETRRVRQLTHNPAEDAMPSWSTDGRWIYFASNRKGDFQIYKVLAPHGESPSRPPLQVTTGGGFNAMESPDGKYLYFAKNRESGGLWRRLLDGPGIEPEEPVLDSISYYGWWTVGPSGIFFLEREDERPNAKVHLKFLDLSSRKIQDLTTLPYPIWRPWTAVLTASPDGHHVVFEQGENWISNIVLIENFR